MTGDGGTSQHPGAGRGRRILRRLAQWLSLGLVLVLWGAYLARSWGQLAGHEWHVAYWPLAGALLGWVAGFLMLAVGWVILVRQAGAILPLRSGVPVWALSMPARYVPGNVWHVAGRLYLGSRLGLGADTLLGATAVEQILTLLGALLLGLPLGMPWTTETASFRATWALPLALVAGLGLAGVHPRSMGAVLRLAGWALRKPAASVQVTYRGVAAALGWYTASSLVGGIAFWLLVASLGGAGWPELPRLVGAYCLAFALGYLSFVTPAGLGAREAALALLLGGVVPSPVAVGASLLARVCSSLAELGCVAAIALWTGRSGLRRDQAPAAR